MTTFKAGDRVQIKIIESREQLWPNGCLPPKDTNERYGTVYKRIDNYHEPEIGDDVPVVLDGDDYHWNYPVAEVSLVTPSPATAPTEAAPGAGDVPAEVDELYTTIFAERKAFASYEVMTDEQIKELQAELARLAAELTAAREELAAYKTDNTDLERQVNKAEARVKFMKHSAEMHREQYRQEHDNAFMLYKALTRNTAPDIYKPVLEGLFQSTNEYDKLMSEGSRWKERHQREVWKREGVEKELTATRELLVEVHRNAPQQEPRWNETARNYPIAHSFWQAGKMIHAFLSGEGEAQS